VRLLATDCAQARESVSAQLDGELLELELDRLETHLRLCPGCTAWAAQVRDVTGTMRDAAFEAPVLTGFVPPRRSRRWAVSASVALASAAAVVATMFVPGQSVARQHVSVTRFTGAQEERVTVPRVPRLLRLEDGLYTPVSSSPPSQGRLRPV
jgi:predicted anti-sigma-YlaC factor YlaD